MPNNVVGAESQHHMATFISIQSCPLSYSYRRPKTTTHSCGFITCFDSFVERDLSMELGEGSKVSPRRGETWKVGPGELLEEGWFFGNLLDRKTRIMSRCYSDPSPSSKVSQEIFVGRSYEETYSTINKVLFPCDGCGFYGEVVTTPHPPRPSSMRAQSMPSPYTNKSSRAQSLNTTSNNRLHRTPSLPIMDEDMHNIEDEESEYSMGRLIRQASLGQSQTLPPRKQTPKKLVHSIIPKDNNSRKKLEHEGSIERRRQQVLKHANVEIEQAKSSKGSDMGTPIKEIKVLPKLQEVKIMKEAEEKDHDSNGIINTRKPYVPEVRRLARTTSASPILDNIGRQKTDDIMKAQIKFWARAVATNVI